MCYHDAFDLFLHTGGILRQLILSKQLDFFLHHMSFLSKVESVFQRNLSHGKLTAFYTLGNEWHKYYLNKKASK